MRDKTQQRADVLRAALAGDALGRPFNGLRHGHVRQVLGGAPDGFLADDAILFPEKPPRNVLTRLYGPFGQRILASLAHGKTDDLGREPVALAGAALLDLAGGPDNQDDGALRDPGRPLRRALARWRTSYPWDPADYLAPGEASEGLATAAAGIAVHLLSPAEPVATAEALARLTHDRLLGVAPALLTTLVLDAVANQPNATPRALLEPVLARLREWERVYTAQRRKAWREAGADPNPPSLAEALATLPLLLEEGRDDLAESTLLKAARATAPRHDVTHTQHGYSIAGLGWALWRGLGPHSAVHAIADIQERGGESAAIAAIASALRVLRHGPDCLFPHWIAGTRALDDAMAWLATPAFSAAEPWIAAEQQLSADELALRARLQKAIDDARRRDAAKGKPAPAKKPKPRPAPLPDQEAAPFAPPPHLWLDPADEDDPRKKKLLKAARGRRKIDWKEERRKRHRDEPGGEPG